MTNIYIYIYSSGGRPPPKKLPLISIVYTYGKKCWAFRCRMFLPQSVFVRCRTQNLSSHYTPFKGKQRFSRKSSLSSTERVLWERGTIGLNDPNDNTKKTECTAENFHNQHLHKYFRLLSITKRAPAARYTDANSAEQVAKSYREADAKHAVAWGHSNSLPVQRGMRG